MVEQKHHKLARSLRSGPINRELKPNAATRDQLNVSHMLLGPVILVIRFRRILKIVKGPPELVLLDLIYNNIYIFNMWNTNKYSVFLSQTKPFYLLFF